MITAIHVLPVHTVAGSARFNAPCGHLAAPVKEPCVKPDRNGDPCALGAGHALPCVASERMG